MQWESLMILKMSLLYRVIFLRGSLSCFPLCDNWELVSSLWACEQMRQAAARVQLRKKGNAILREGFSCPFGSLLCMLSQSCGANHGKLQHAYTVSSPNNPVTLASNAHENNIPSILSRKSQHQN